MTDPSANCDLEPDRSSATLLADLAQIHTRTVASPLPQHPGHFGWQMMAGSLAAGFSVALHELAKVDPERAERVAVWYHGPFGVGEGPNPVAFSAWAEEHIAGSPEKFQEWVDEAREQAAAVERKVSSLDAGERVAAGVSTVGQGDDTSTASRSEVEPYDQVLVPSVDPVPHYNRGRARVAPHTTQEN